MLQMYINVLHLIEWEKVIMQQCKKASKISISGATNEENEIIVLFVEFESME